MNRRALFTVVLLAAALAGAVMWRMSVGHPVAPENWSFAFDLRAWRTITGATVGACLAVAGVLLQALLRNSLASPDITGMSAAASLSVMVSLFLAAGAGAELTQVRAWQAAPALIGATGSLALVYALSQRRGVLDPTAMVLIGVVVSVMCGAGVMLIQHLMPGVTMTAGGMRLLVGAISDDVSRTHVTVVAIIAMGATAVAWRLGPSMDAVSFGDDEAASLGVPIGRMRFMLLGLAGVLTAGAVMLAGPLGFIGLVAPHAVRLLAGPGLGSGTSRGSGGAGKRSGTWGGATGNRLVVMGSVLAGAALVVGADALVKMLPTRAGNMPIGILTALVGGATFIALLRAERRR